MNSNVSLSAVCKTLVYACARLRNGSISRSYDMDLHFDEDAFHCKFRTRARSINPDKLVFVYLFLDSGHIRSIEQCDLETIPQEVTNAFVKHGRCTSSTDIMGLRFDLQQQAPVVVPDSALQKRPSTCKSIDALLRLGQCESFIVFVPSGSVQQARLSKLCDSLGRGLLKPDSGVIKTLHAGRGSKCITHLDELWSMDQVDVPPTYEASTAPGAGDEATAEAPKNKSVIEKDEEFPATYPEARGKRRIESPGSHQTPPKRRPKTEEEAGYEPWEMAIAAQNVQLAALSAQIACMREEMQLRRVPMVDAMVQTEGASFGPATRYTSPSQASTVENTIEDRLVMIEESFIDEQKKRTLLEEKVNVLEEECNGFQEAIDGLESRVDDLENVDDVEDDLKQCLDEKGLEIQIKLEEFIEQRLENVEETVKQDVRYAMENASYNFKMDLGWVDE